MVLHVEFTRLAEEAKRFGVKPWVYLLAAGTKVVATIADTERSTIIQAERRGSMEMAVKEASELGLVPCEGRWTPDPLAGEIHVQEQLWTAAVAYKSSDEKPGLWIHGYRGTPSVGDVLRDFFEEMSSETDLGGVSLDDFIAAVCPNVLVLGPNELSAFADQD